MIKMLRVAYCLLGICFFSTAASAYEQEMQGVAKTLSEKIAAAHKKHVAVADFTDLQGNTTELGKFLADELAAVLADSASFTVVDTNQLRLLAKQHNLRPIGAIDLRDIQRFGQVVGVDTVVTGRITPLAKHIRVSVTALDAVNAAVLGSARVSIERSADIDSLLNRRATETNSSGERTAGETTTPAGSPKTQEPVDAKDGDYRGEVVACGTSEVPIESGKICVRMADGQTIQALFDGASQVYVPNVSYPVLQTQLAVGDIVRVSVRDVHANRITVTRHRMP